MKSLLRKALISLSLEDLGNAVIYPESVGELGRACSSSPDGSMVGIHGIPWNFPLKEDEACPDFHLSKHEDCTLQRGKL